MRISSKSVQWTLMVALRAELQDISESTCVPVEELISRLMVIRFRSATRNLTIASVLKLLSMIAVLGSPLRKYTESQKQAASLLSQFLGLDSRATISLQTIGASPRTD